MVAVYGVGGIGINAVQGARYAGAKNVVAIDPLENKREMERDRVRADEQLVGYPLVGQAFGHQAGRGPLDVGGAGPARGRPLLTRPVPARNRRRVRAMPGRAPSLSYPGGPPSGCASPRGPCPPRPAARLGKPVSHGIPQ